MKARRNEAMAVIAFILATAGCVATIFTIEGVRRSRLFTVELIARAPEYGNYYPREFTVTAGEEVRLMIRNIDTVTHGFAIPELGVAISEIKAGEVKTILFTPRQKGTYSFLCTVWCSDRHMEMSGEITIE